MAEIEGRLSLLEGSTGHPEVVKRVEGVIKAYKSILSFLETLEVKEVDLENEITRVSKNKYFDFTDWKSVARHFFELGLQTHIPVIYKPTETDVYKLGLRAHKGE